jgi:hypothetical protein
MYVCRQPEQILLVPSTHATCCDPTHTLVQIWTGLTAACLHTNQSRSYLNHIYRYIYTYIYKFWVLNLMYSAWGWSVWPKHVTCIDGTNNIGCGWRCTFINFLHHTCVSPRSMLSSSVSLDSVSTLTSQPQFLMLIFLGRNLRKHPNRWW